MEINASRLTLSYPSNSESGFVRQLRFACIAHPPVPVDLHSFVSRLTHTYHVFRLLHPNSPVLSASLDVQPVRKNSYASCVTLFRQAEVCLCAGVKNEMASVHTQVLEFHFSPANE